MRYGRELEMLKRVRRDAVRALNEIEVGFSGLQSLGHLLIDEDPGPLVPHQWLRDRRLAWS